MQGYRIVTNSEFYIRPSIFETIKVMTEQIVKSISRTIKPVKVMGDLPDDQGVYEIYVNKTTDLGKFGKPGQLIYVGIAEKSLANRDIETHFKTGKTGWSSLRRSIGAILKTQLELTAQKREINTKKSFE